jgi:pimeloyl-ACP methyl ester carboxylesterase
MTALRATALLAGIALVPALAGCITMTIDEETAFRPPQRTNADATPVTDAASLAARWEPVIRARLEPRGFTFETVAPDTLVIRSPNPDDTDIAISHGVLSLPDAGHLAVSLLRDPDAPADRPLIVHCAGNAGDRYNSALRYAGKALPWGDVLVFDYPGYGDSSGTPTASALEAASAALQADITARTQGASGARDLVFWGHSLGGFVCARLAERTPGTDALILETTARSASEVAKAWKPWWSGPFVRINVAETLAGYDTARSAAAFGGPVLVIGAGQDDTLPVGLARSLASALRELTPTVTYVELPDATHNGAPDDPGFTPAVSAFLEPVLER